MKISILTTIYNDIDTVDEFITAVKNQIIPSGHSVQFIICDDGSTDGTERIIANVNGYKKSSLSVRTVRNENNRGIFPSINHLYDLSDGEIIVFTDADAISLDQYWLSKLTDPIINNQQTVVQGNFWRQYNQTGFIVKQHELWRRSAFLKRYLELDGTLKTINTRNLAVKRDVLVQIHNKFSYILNPNIKYGADVELGFRIHGLGFKIILNESAVVCHSDPVSFLQIIKQKARHGYNDGKIGISYSKSFYHAVWYPFIHDNVSVFFSLPCMLIFRFVNLLGIVIYKLSKK